MAAHEANKTSGQAEPAGAEVGTAPNPSEAPMAEMEMVERVKAVPVRTGWIRYGALPVRAVVLREEFNGQVAYSAHGLERDIAAQGSSPEQAMRRLQMCATFDAKLDHTRTKPLGAAPLHVHDWHAAALTAPKERG